MIHTEQPFIPGYTVKGLLGEGGMARVYLAIQESFNRPVALKVMAPHLFSDAGFVQRFHREAHLAANLSHQSIVPIFDIGQHENFLYMSMEYLPGGDLKQKIDQGIQIMDSLRIVKAIALALDYSGRKGLVHRDIKPENILFREDGTPAIADFGIARQINSQTNMTRVGSSVGTPNYMSPEQAQGQEVDGRADLYSLGIILYELLTGRVPFASESAISVSVKHITEAPPPLDPFLANFQPIIDKALSKDPNHRFQTGNDFAQAMTRIEDSLSITCAKTLVLNTQDVLAAAPSSSFRQDIDSARSNGYSASLYPLNQAETSSNPSQFQSSYHSTLQNANALQLTTLPHNKFKYLSVILGCLLIFAIGLLTAFSFDDSGSALFDAKQYAESQVDLTVEQQQSVSESKKTALSLKAKERLKQGQLLEPDNDSAKYYVTTLLALDPGNREALVIVRTLYGRVVAEAEKALSINELKQADFFLKHASQLDYYIDDLTLNERFKQAYDLYSRNKSSSIEAELGARIEKLLLSAKQAFDRENLISPFGDNAYEYYQKILVLDETNQQAAEGILHVASQLLLNAQARATESHFSAAHSLLTSAIQIGADKEAVNRTKAFIEGKQNDHALVKLEKDAANNQIDYTLAQNILKKERANKEEDINRLLQKAEEFFNEGALIQPDKKNALFFYNAILEIDSSHVEALNGKNNIAVQLVDYAVKKAEEGDVNAAFELINEAKKLSSNEIAIRKAETIIHAIDKQQRIAELLSEANSALNRNRLKFPIGNSAEHYFQEALKISPDNLEAMQGLSKIGHRYILLAKKALTNSQKEKAEEYLSNAEAFLGKSPEISILMEEVATIKSSVTMLPKNNNLKNNDGLIAAMLFNAQKLLEAPSYENLKQARLNFDKVMLEDPDNLEAKSGIALSLELQLKLAEDSMLSNKADSAREHLSAINAIDPDFELNGLKAQLAAAAIQPLLKEVKELIGYPYRTPGLFETNEKSRGYLTKAYQALDVARRTDPGSSEVANLLDKLDQKYSEIISLLLNSKSKEEAYKFILDTAKYHWDSPRVDAIITKLSVESETPMTIRVLTDNTVEKIKIYQQKVRDLIRQPYEIPGLFGSNDEARSRLRNAYEYILKIHAISSNTPIIGALMFELDSKYKLIIKLLVSKGKMDEAFDFVRDAKQYDWNKLAPELNAISEESAAVLERQITEI
jgi:serine/threonine protein kinase